MTPLPSFDDIRSGSKPAMARALAAIEERGSDPDFIRLLDEAWTHPKGHVLGLTGPPGVGKSTLTSALIRLWREEGRTVGVIAVDPSSRRTGGALLGDRTRIVTDPEDTGVFIRSMAARDRLGGIARETAAAMTLMRAAYDRVIIETVGVGQSETEVADIADTVVFCVQPASGDSLQFMKAGIMEVPDIVAVTKADLGAPAMQAKADVEGALSLNAPSSGWGVEVIALSSTAGQGVGELAAAIEEHRGWLSQERRAKKKYTEQAKRILTDAVLDRFGREGLRKAASMLEIGEGASPFGIEARIAQTLTGA